jgi:ABC-type spermidine/putrescine transport system permease subunit II
VTVLVLVLVPVALLVLVPVALIVANSFATSQSGQAVSCSLRPWTQALGDPAQIRTLANTFELVLARDSRI